MFIYLYLFIIIWVNISNGCFYFLNNNEFILIIDYICIIMIIKISVFKIFEILVLFFNNFF